MMGHLLIHRIRIVIICWVLLYALLLALFVWIAWTVASGHMLPFDKSLMLEFHTQSSTLLTVFMVMWSQFGSPVSVALIGVSLATPLVAQRQHAAVVLVMLGLGGAGIINVTLKQVFARTRPDFWEHLVHASGYSFPSGHAAGSMALVIVCIILTWHTGWRWAALVYGGLFTLLVGISRVYLGVHYPSDVLAGWVVGFVWVTCIYGVLYSYNNHKYKESMHLYGKSTSTSRN